MPEVELTRRWGSHAAGDTVEVDEVQAAWLYGNHYAGDSRHGGQGGVDGSDNRAGGDVSRRRMTSARSARVEQNLTGRVQGAPSPVGDVTHVAEENLGKENRKVGTDRLLASGKTLTEELAEQQREIEEAEKAAAKDSGRAKRSDDSADAGSPEGTSAPASAEGRKLTQAKRKD